MEYFRLWYTHYLAALKENPRLHLGELAGGIRRLSVGSVRSHVAQKVVRGLSPEEQHDAWCTRKAQTVGIRCDKPKRPACFRPAFSRGETLFSPAAEWDVLEAS